MDLLKTLKAPGEGLLTVTTGAPFGGSLQKYFSSAPKLWSKQLKKNLEQSFVILGVPSDVGAGVCRGSAHGPRALRASLYKKFPHYRHLDIGDIPCIPQLLHDSMYDKKQLNKSYKSLWGKTRAPKDSVAPLSLLADVCEELLKQNKQFLLLGGDHSLSWAPFEAMRRRKIKNIGVLHLDAHTDLMEDRFGVQHCFSTWAAHSVKVLSKPQNFFQLGVRVSKQSKSYWEKKYALQQYWAKEVLSRKASFWAEKILKTWAQNKVSSFYVSFDVDVLDPKFAPSTGTPEKNGLSVNFVRELLFKLSAELPLIGADLVEVAPVLGSKKEADKTVQNALKSIEALLP